MAELTKFSSVATIVDQTKRFSALQIASYLGDKNFVAVAERHISVNNHQVNLNSLMADYRVTGIDGENAATTFQALEQSMREYKGTTSANSNLLELRLYLPERQIERLDLKELVVAYAPPGSPKNWKTVEAFDRHGATHHLDAQVPPAMPILIVGIDQREDLRVGSDLLNKTLQFAGMQSAPYPASGNNPELPNFAPIDNLEVTKLDHIRLRSDNEPWILGSAEIYAIVSGIHPDQNMPTLTFIAMPYLSYDKRTYHPNQIMILWSEYRYGAANLQLFEHDDSISYKDLAVALTKGVTAALGPFVPTHSTVGQIGKAIVQSMPQGWFTNDDDYVDSFYALEKGRTYMDFIGTANNATATLTPYVIYPNLVTNRH